MYNFHDGNHTFLNLENLTKDNQYHWVEVNDTIDFNEFQLNHIKKVTYIHNAFWERIKHVKCRRETKELKVYNNQRKDPERISYVRK